MSRNLMQDFQAEQRDERLSSDKPSRVKPPRYVNSDEYMQSLEEMRGYIGDLEEEVSRLKKFAKTLNLPPVIAMPQQRQLSIPVATDEGGLGTTTMPQAGQVPVGQSNKRYLPGSAGGLFYAITNTTSVAYAALSSDDVILADAVGGAITVTLPTAVGRTGKVYTVKRINAGANAVTIATTGGQTIDGAATQVLTIQYTSIDIVSDGANWSII